MSIILFAAACVLLFFAYNSVHEEADLEPEPVPAPAPAYCVPDAKPHTPFHYPATGQTDDLAARLEHSDRLWAKSLKGRKRMIDSYKESARQNRK